MASLESTNINNGPEVVSENKRTSFLLFLLVMLNVGLFVNLFLKSKDFYNYDVFTWKSLTGFLSDSAYFGFSVGIETLFLLVMSILIIALNISGKNWNKKLAYRIPMVLCVPVPLLLLYAFTCSGKFCSFGPMLLSIFMGAGAIASAIAYTIGLTFRKWPVKNLFFSLVLVVLFVLSSFGYLGYIIIRDYPIAQYIADKEVDINKAVVFCDNYQSSIYRKQNCWELIAEKNRNNPDISICSSVIKQSSKDMCYQEMILRFFYNCNGQKDKCWIETANKYLGIDVCQFTYNFQKDDCNKANHPELKTVE